MSMLDLPAPYPWPDGKKSAFCFSIDVDAHSPWMWNNRNDVPELLSHLEQRRYGPRIGIRRIADLLARHDIKASFFVPAAVAEENPWMLPALVEAGHEVGLHGYFHELVSQTRDDEFTRVLEASIALFERQTGQKPAGFRSPAWEMTPHMLAEVKRHGFYDSSLMGSDTPYAVHDVTEVPVNWATDDAIFFKFLDGSDTRAPLGTNQMLDAWKEELAASRRFSTLFMLTVHDWISGRGSRIAMLDRLVEDVLSDDSIWVATAGEIAAHYRDHAAGRDAVSPEIPASLYDHPAWKGE
ncbi:polysaccharide deacetylase family protein [Martelella mangrovi]|uniref:Chitooligosaccharide deacetylase n=1 Tax=Martelella mangrovi TaxID=1397477 RepID=A0ABV2IEE3_9HYPH